MTLFLKNISSDVSRRKVLKGLGGLVLSVPLASTSVYADLLIDEGNNGDAFKPSAYFSIHPDGQIKIMIHRVEMGQGTRTGLAQVIADELEVNWDDVDFLQAEGHEKYGVQNTDGSRSIRNYYYPLRKAAAAARMMLESAGAKHFGVPFKGVKADNGFIVAGSKKVAYKDLVTKAKAEKPPVDDAVKLKDRSEFKHIRKPRQILDMHDITHGKALYAQDIRLEGMLYSVIARPPVPGGVVKSYDDSAAKAVKGVVKIIKMRDQAFPSGFMPLGGIAVIATNTYAAMKARDALEIDWNDGANASYSSDTYEKALWESIEKGGNPLRKVGNGAEGLKEASKVLSSQYYIPHQSHQHLEPPAAVAEWKNGECVIFASTQTPQRSRQMAAAYCGVPKEKVTSHSPLLGAGFGRKSKPDFSAEAAFLAKEMGKPVKVIWTREDDMKHGYYHTVSAQQIDVGLNENGKVTTWRHRAAYPAIGGTFDPRANGPSAFELSQCAGDLPFDLDHMSVESCEAKTMTRVGWMRSVNCIHQGFAAGSMVGEIAAETGKNQLETWLELIGPDRIVDIKSEGMPTYDNYGNSTEDHPFDTARLKHVLRKAAEMAGYENDQSKDGKGIGLAVFRSFNSFVACAIEADASQDGIKIPRAWIAVDCGVAVNPDRIKSQMEGAVVFGMAYFFHSAITMENGRTVEGNFDTNPLPRIDEAPHVEVHIVDSEASPGGVGEPGVSPVAGAITNAIFAANGQRIKRLPFKG
ncbi:molybdopterin-dependent oxidoreductase [Temperatibacter marinus]|uniref:Molybdopterin-dependent oxidoreductase n=1 Tax=Temperatibacter marinus TaxID=1456591 RepID=A0AA52H895_9PROT|nr:molybdopterin cofactor-binding domain-containing protein [Temperatibacter marinus]WND01896.1 molybdopterin-dependent oxidoreductase [Temperatibacter marinus]